MYYNYITVSCPTCKKMLFFKFLKIYGFIRVTSGLGPNFIICSSCNTKMQTNYKEWHQMSLAEKLWYLVLSIIYGFILGFISSITIGMAFEKMLAQTLSADLAELIIIASITLIVLVIQILRIFISIERIEDNKGSEKSVNFWDWETNLQIYGILWIILTIFGVIPFL
jgi:cytochrome c biogenesis protein CcdA